MKEKGKAIAEFFFISNQKNAKIFSEIYEIRNNYSIRPSYAAKQHLEKNKIPVKEILEFMKDFNIQRVQENKENEQRLLVRLIGFLKKTIKLFLKKILYA